MLNKKELWLLSLLIVIVFPTPHTLRMDIDRQVQVWQMERNSPEVRKKGNPRGCRGQTAPFIHLNGSSRQPFSPHLFLWESLLMWTWLCSWNRCCYLFQTMCDPDQPEKWQVGSLQGNGLPWAVWHCCAHDAGSSDSAASRWHRELWVSACAVCLPREMGYFFFFERARIQLNSLSKGYSIDPTDLHVL